MAIDTKIEKIMSDYQDKAGYWGEKDYPNLFRYGDEYVLVESPLENLERDVLDMKMAEYMEDHIGEEFEGTIDSIMNFGMFICLPNMIEGLVKYENIKGDYFEFNEDVNMLIGKRTGKKYRLGQKVRVKCIAASKDNSTIDFELVKGDKDGNSK